MNVFKIFINLVKSVFIIYFVIVNIVIVCSIFFRKFTRYKTNTSIIP